MPTRLDGQAQDRVTWIHERHERRNVCIRAAVRLHIRVPAAEESLRPRASELLHFVVKLASAVVALARIPLRVLVGHPRACGMHDCRTHMVLAGDEFERRLLPLLLPCE